MRALRSIVIVSAMLVCACGDDAHAVIKDSGAPLDANVLVSPDAGKDAGEAPFVPPPVTTAMSIMCGSQTCEVSAPEFMLGVMPCCFEADTCGEMTPLVPGCMALGQPGGVDPTCPGYDVSGLFTWPGCCTPDGACGALDDSETGFGCIPNADLNATEQSCDYDPDNQCSRILEAECDGPEDCAKGQMCCGEFDGGYRRLSCQDDCAALEVSTMGVWSEICHPGATCADATFECRANTDYLPDYLYRCRETGTDPGAAGSTRRNEVNCGDATCGGNEKCCIPAPEGEPYCAPEGELCRCGAPADGSDAGADDAG